ncbi:MAG: T9SS type A sorting domain-containing protein [Bacteroidota bacterium]
MKKHLLFLLLLTQNACSFSQSYFYKEYDNNGKAEFGLGVTETTNHDFVIVGMTGDPLSLLGNYQGWILKINSEGDTLWTKQYGDYGTDLFTSILPHDTNFIISGIKFVYGKGRDGWLMEVDSFGNKIWEKTYGGTGYTHDGLSSIIPTSDGGYLMTGSTESFGTDSTQDAWLIKLNSSFDTMWTRTYDMGVINETTSFTDDGINIVPFQNNKYIFAVNTCESGCDGIDPHLYASYIIVDSVGNVLLSRSYTDGPKNKFKQIASTSDGSAIIAGATSMRDSVLFTLFRSEDMWVLKLTSDATDTLWTKSFGENGIYDGGWSIFETDDGGYMMSAYSQIDCTPSYNYDNIWWMKLDSNGDTTCVRRWGGPDNDDLLYIIPTSDGGIIGTGGVNGNSNPLEGPIPGDADLVIIKTDAQGLITGIENTESENVFFSIYPNPASDHFTLMMNINAEEIITAELFDLTGRIIFEENFISSSNGMQILEFSVPQINSGIYYLQVRSNNFSKTIPVEIFNN